MEHTITLNNLDITLIKECLVNYYNDLERQYTKIKTDYYKQYNQKVRDGINNVLKKLDFDGNNNIQVNNEELENLDIDDLRQLLDNLRNEDKQRLNASLKDQENDNKKI